jgi:long-subunit acyl-CoA synthetase (AMP-forming)
MKKHLSVMILDECRRQGDRDALASKSGGAWKKISWKKMAEQIQQVGQGLLEFGVKPQENIAIFSPNRPEWAIADYGIMSARCVTVPVYATNSSEQAEYIVNDASIRIIFVGVQEQYDAVMKFFGKNEHLEKVIVFDRAVPIAKNEKIMYFSDFLEKGRPHCASAISTVLSRRRARRIPAPLSIRREPPATPKAWCSPTRIFSASSNVSMKGSHEQRDIALCFLP